MEADQKKDGKWTIAVTGSTGLIGSALVEALRSDGHTVKRLVRREPSGADEVRWSPGEGQVDAQALAGVDAVVNLAGEPIAKRWTEARRRRMWDSRVNGTRALAEAMARLEPRPRVLINASGMNYYGYRADEVVDEQAGRGEGFLAELCGQWETAAQPAADAGIRTVYLRSGMVLSAEGGALAQMLPIFRLGLGGRLGDGRHWWSWISLDDHVGAMRHALAHDEVSGPVNMGSPNPVTNAEFTKVLGRVLRRPTVLPAPRFALRAVFGGQMADETLFVSIRMRPAVLERTGYRFAHPDLEGALHFLLA